MPVATFLPTVGLAAPSLMTSQMVDDPGIPLGTPANPFTFAPNGSTETDYSANATAVSATPLTMIPATASRAQVKV